MTTYRVYRTTIELIVSDRAALAAHALQRALDAGISEQEFKSYETQAYEADNEIGFWLSWTFDNGSPPGVEIQDTTTDCIYAGEPT